MSPETDICKELHKKRGGFGEVRFRARVQIPEGFDSKPARVETVFFTLADAILRSIPILITHSHTQLLSIDCWTGLEDINTTDIYEGDVVSGSMLGVVEYRPKRGSYVINRDVIKGQDGMVDMPLIIPKPMLEIIGNIYENPELFKGNSHGN